MDAVLWALEAGYRHIDTAQGYHNEASVGQALQQSGLPREDVFITTKFLPSNRDPAPALEASLERLDLEYVDLYLVHWPEGGPTWAWQGMEQGSRRGPYALNRCLKLRRGGAQLRSGAGECGAGR